MGIILLNVLFKGIVVPILPETDIVVRESGENRVATPDTRIPASIVVKTESEMALLVLKLTTEDSFPPYFDGNPPFIISTSETINGSIEESKPEK